MQIKNRKNIGQKISFLYNIIYLLLIRGYYNEENQKQNIRKEELMDYYENIVISDDIADKHNEGQNMKGFILQYYNNNVTRNIYELINLYYNKYYISISKSILLLLIIFIAMMIIIYLYKLK